MCLQRQEIEEKLKEEQKYRNKLAPGGRGQGSDGHMRERGEGEGEGEGQDEGVRKPKLNRRVSLRFTNKKKTAAEPKDQVAM